MSLYMLRKAKGFSCKDVAEKMGITAGYYSHLENGRRRFNVSLLKKLSEVLGEPVGRIEEHIAEIDDQSLLTRNWIANIKIHGQNVLKAFENELVLNKPLEDVEEVKIRFAGFIRDNIAQSVMAELSSDMELLEMLRKKYRHLTK